MRVLDELDRSAKVNSAAMPRSRTKTLLERLRHAALREPADLIRLHETVLFLRAFPQSPRVARLTDRDSLFFRDRMRGVDPAPFDDPEVSGIAGTAVSTNFSYEFATSLMARHRPLDLDRLGEFDASRGPPRQRAGTLDSARL